MVSESKKNQTVTLETPGAGVASVLKIIVSEEGKLLEDRLLGLHSALIFIDHKPLAPATAWSFFLKRVGTSFCRTSQPVNG